MREIRGRDTGTHREEAPPVRKLLLLGAILVSTTTGCAFTPVDVHPPEAASPRRGANLASSKPGRNREVIVVAPFRDDRHDPGRCGMQKNGYNMDTAVVECTLEPGRWFADELALELTRAGYRPLRSDAVPGPSTIVVRGSVQQLFLEPVHHFFTLTVEGDFAAHLTVTSTSGLHAERTFFVKGTDTGMASTESTFQAAADNATHRMARAMVVSLTELLDRYPDLGAPTASAPTAQRSP
ncbi:MAG: exported protein of unknown function [Labilithrix sp.]|nr:exported protein of unknown function [Labilithrix sp.]